MSRLPLGTALLGAAFLFSPYAHADNGTTLNATYDFQSQDTLFALTNNGTGADTNVTLYTDATVTLYGDTTPATVFASVQLDDIDAGGTETYAFNQPNGGFIINPAAKGLTLADYWFTYVYDGVLFTSNLFSQANNLTGGDVDFLGTQCYGLASGCPVALSGIVAQAPEPAGFALLPLPLAALAFALRRRRA